MTSLTKTERLIDFLTRARGPLTLIAYAAALGISRETIRLWLKGEVFPSDENLRKLAESRGWTLEELKRFLALGVEPEITELGRVLDYVKRLHPREALQVQVTLTARFTDLLLGGDGDTEAE